MTRKEAVIYLMDNPKAKLKMTKKRTGVEMGFNEFITMSETGIIEDSDSDSFALYVEDDEAEFEVVRELRKMSFGEAFYYYSIGFLSDTIVSIVSGDSFVRDEDLITLEEYVGEWTVSGVYE